MKKSSNACIRIQNCYYCFEWLAVMRLFCVFFAYMPRAIGGRLCCSRQQLTHRRAKPEPLRLRWNGMARDARTARTGAFHDVKLGHGDCVRGSFVVFFELTRLLQKWFLGAPTCTYSSFILVPRVVKHFSVTFELAMATMANVPMQCVQLCCAVRLQDAIL